MTCARRWGNPEIGNLAKVPRKRFYVISPTKAAYNFAPNEFSADVYCRVENEFGHEIERTPLGVITLTDGAYVFVVQVGAVIPGSVMQMVKRYPR